jgi:hypothetical protein
MKLFRYVVGIFLLLLGTGCATLDKSECRKADWEVIGLEDGARGRPLSYLGRHREACAEHGVKPSLAQYRAGHATGVRQYCTPQNGFRQGRAGRRYEGVCPDDLEGSFLAGYETGRELHNLSADINRMQTEVSGMQDELDGLRQRQQNVENLLVSGTVSASVRQSLLDQFKRNQGNIAALEIGIHDTELEAARLQGVYDALDASHGY